MKKGILIIILFTIIGFIGEKFLGIKEPVLFYLLGFLGGSLAIHFLIKELIKKEISIL